MSMPIGNDLTRSILSGWENVKATPDADRPGEVKITTRSVDVKDVIRLTSPKVPKTMPPKVEPTLNGVARLVSMKAFGPLQNDMSTAVGARDALMKYCENFRKNFVNHGGLVEQVQAFQDKVDAMPEGTDAEKLAKQQAQEKVNAYADKVRALQEQRLKLLENLPKPSVSPNLNSDAKDFEEKRALAELSAMKTAVRNFRYDFDRVYAPDKITDKRLAGQRLSSTRNKFFRALATTKLAIQIQGSKGGVRTAQDVRKLNQKQEVPPEAFKAVEETAGKLYDETLQLRDLLDVKDPPPDRVDFTSFTGKQREALSEAMLRLEEAVRTKSGDVPMSQVGREQLLTTLKEIGTPGKGGCKELAIVIKAGIAVPIPIGDLSVGAKYEYKLVISSPGDGSIKIERVHAAGVNAQASINAGEVAKVKVEGGLKGGKGRTWEFDNLDEAVRDLGSNGFRGVVDGLWTGGVSGKLLGIPGRWLNRLFGLKNNYNEESFLRFSRKNGYLDKADKVQAHGTNVRRAAHRTFARIDLGASGSAQFQTMRARADIKAKGEWDRKAKLVEYRSLFTYLRSERLGEAGKIYRKLAGDDAVPADKRLEDETQVLEILNRKVETDEERAALRQDIRAAIDAIGRRGIASCEDLNDRLAAGEKIADADYKDLAVRYPRATAAMQALLDRLAAVSKGATEAELKETDELAKTVEEILLNPSVKFPQDIYDKYFSVTRVHQDDKDRFKGEFRFSIDVMADANVKLLTETGLASKTTYATGTMGEKIGKGVGRALADGAVNAVEKQLGLKSAVFVNVNAEKPRTDDPRPWKRHCTTTLDIRLQDNLPLDAIILAVQKAVRGAADMKESGISVDRAKTAGVNTLTGALTRAFSDFTKGANADDKLRESASVFAESVLDEYTWECLKNIRLTFEDGKLASVAFGDAEIMRIEVSAKAGPVRLGGGFSYESLVNSSTTLINPSFNTLCGYCDGYLKHANTSAWTQFAAKNGATFLKAFKHLAGKGMDKRAKADRAQFEAFLSRASQDLDPKGDVQPSVRKRLEARLDAIQNARDEIDRLSHLAVPTDKKEAAILERKKIDAVRTLLERITQYCDTLDDQNDLPEMLAPTLRDENLPQELDDKDRKWLPEGSLGNDFTIVIEP